jgi:DNA-damage-inducible protein J
MAVSNINILVDSDVKLQAQQVFESLGLDMSSAVELFLKQTIAKKSIPIKLEAAKKTRNPGCMAGEIWMADDFDEPLEDFKDYM